MKRLVVVALMLMCLAGMAWAAEKEELNWKYRALVAEFNAAQQRLPQFQALSEFVQELDKKGFIIEKGVVVEKPKPAPEPKK